MYASASNFISLNNLKEDLGFLSNLSFLTCTASESKCSFLAIVAHTGGDLAANQLQEKGLRATLLIVATSRPCHLAATLLKDGVFTSIAKALHMAGALPGKRVAACEDPRE